MTKCQQLSYEVGKVPGLNDSVCSGGFVAFHREIKGEIQISDILKNHEVVHLLTLQKNMS